MDTNKLKHFYQLETSQLNSLCEKWQRILDDGSKKNEDTKGAIMSTLGQCRLLLSKRLKQFEQLLSDAEQKITTEKRLIRQSDLEGYWETVMIQVNDVYRKFAELENTIRPGTERPKNKNSAVIIRNRNSSTIPRNRRL